MKTQPTAAQHILVDRKSTSQRAQGSTAAGLLVHQTLLRLSWSGTGMGSMEDTQQCCFTGHNQLWEVLLCVRSTWMLLHCWRCGNLLLPPSPPTENQEICGK